MMHGIGTPRQSWEVEWRNGGGLNLTLTPFQKGLTTKRRVKEGEIRSYSMVRMIGCEKKIVFSPFQVHLSSQVEIPFSFLVLVKDRAKEGEKRCQERVVRMMPWSSKRRFSPFRRSGIQLIQKSFFLSNFQPPPLEACCQNKTKGGEKSARFSPFQIEVPSLVEIPFPLLVLDYIYGANPNPFKRGWLPPSHHDFINSLFFHRLDTGCTLFRQVQSLLGQLG